MPFAELGPCRLFYTDEGAGDPVILFIHGYTCDSNDWIFQLPHFTHNHRVVAVDLRGHGRSSSPADGYTVATLAGDLALLLDHLLLQSVVAIGHSLGGVIVSALAVEHPGRVGAVVAVDPAYLLPDEIGTHLGPVLDALRSSDPVPIVQQVIGSFASPAEPPAMRAWHLRRVAGMDHHVLRQVFDLQMSGLALRSRSASYLARRECPVLSFYADPLRAPAEDAILADDRSRTITWEGSGHWLHQERPEEFNALVSTWLAGLA